MVDKLSAPEHSPSDFIREVTPEALEFYVDELSGLHLPEDFDPDTFAAKTWDVKKRLSGKFGRFTVANAEDPETKYDDVLLMGTTVGLGKVDRVGMLSSLYHYNLHDAVWGVLQSRDIIDEISNDAIRSLRVDAVDYGSTHIRLGRAGRAEALLVGSSSMDFGRADTEGRQATCVAFETLLENVVEVINSDPEPREREQLIRKPER